MGMACECTVCGGVWAFLTKLDLGLDGVLSGDNRSAANSVSGADSEQVHGVLLEAADTVLWSISTVCSQRPSLTLHIPSFHHVGDNLASTVALRFLPGQTDLAIGGVNHSQVLDWSGDVWNRTA